MKALIVGSGGREDALMHMLCTSGSVDRSFYIPTNKNALHIGQSVNLKWSDGLAVADFIKDQGIDFTILGPDAVVASGLADRLHEQGIDSVFGPGAKAAMLEWSKVYAKKFMGNHLIPTPMLYNVPVDYSHARRVVNSVLRNNANSIVVKADGLYGGKGVFVCDSQEEAYFAINELMLGKNPSGHRILLEEKVDGTEVSVFALSDGKDYKIIPVAVSDYKRLLDENKGPNTGGMGSIAPVQVNFEEIDRRIIKPTFDGLAQEEISYIGVLYFGLMLTKSGPQLLEYNCRFGDPELQALAGLLENDFVNAMQACTQASLASVDIRVKERASCCVVITEKSYPDEYVKGFPVSGIENVDRNKALVFRAGIDSKNRILGGRVLDVVGLGETLQIARENAYSQIAKINFEGMFYRKDIGELNG